jgi:hypothetical protein
MSQCQKFAQYFDGETGVITRPPESAGYVPFGDGVWRSAWFYASLIVLKRAWQLLFLALVAIPLSREVRRPPRRRLF